MCRTDKFGFPKCHRQNKKIYYGFQTGDIVKANIPKGKYQGQHTGRVVVRASGHFDIKIGQNKPIGTNHKHCRVIQKGDGWQYDKIKAMQ